MISSKESDLTAPMSKELASSCTAGGFWFCSSCRVET